MTTANDVLAHFGLAIGSASKRDVLAASRAACDEGTIQATDALHLFGPGNPCLHTCMSLSTALRHLGCVDADTDAVRRFLALPVEALPGARFAVEADSWAHNAWDVLRRHARTGESITDICGTQIILSADRAEWRDGVTVG